MKNFFKNIKSWSSYLKVSTAVALSSLTIIASSLIYSRINNDDQMVINEISSMNLSSQEVISSSYSSVYKEYVERPYRIEAKIIHYFYDELDAVEIRQKAIVEIPSQSRTYTLSKGCDYANDNQDFTIYASASGYVKDKYQDPIYGEVVIIKTKNDVEFIYASLKDVKVNINQEVVQGEEIATSSTSLYTSKIGSSLHFEVIKNGTYLNPEKIYSLDIQSI